MHIYFTQFSINRLKRSIYETPLPWVVLIGDTMIMYQILISLRYPHTINFYI